MFQFAGALVLAGFLAIYFGKMLLQRRKGIITDQLGKGSKAPSLQRVEVLTKLATFGVVIGQALSIALNAYALPTFWRIVGFVLGMGGVALFGLAVVDMRDSWRAGIPQKAETRLVTTGLYRYSRNPAFLGLGFIDLGLLLMFGNIPLLLLTCFVLVMLHLQILQEEHFLRASFGQTYASYAAVTRRYLGRKALPCNR